MRILVIGGTQFVGRAMVADALRRGHDVSLFHRGRTNPDLFPEATHLIGDRDEDLSVLTDGTWDATIDVCAYHPRQVADLADVLGDRGGHHSFVSTVSVYADPDGPGIDEDAPRRSVEDPMAQPATRRLYGELKTASEDVAAARYPALLTIRPPFVLGPHDHTYRFPTWVARIARGGEVLAPGPADAPISWIDVGDLASFTLDQVERGTTGTFHTAAPPTTFGAFLAEVVDAIDPVGTDLRWIEPERLVAAGLDGRELPLWTGGEPAWSLALDPSRASAAGLEIRPLAETTAATLTWLRSGEAAIPEGMGLDPAREAALLAG